MKSALKDPDKRKESQDELRKHMDEELCAPEGGTSPNPSIESVPLDVWKAELPKFLDPRSLSHLAESCRQFRCFNGEDYVHPEYRTNRAINRACFDGHLDLVKWLDEHWGVKMVDKCWVRAGMDDCTSGRWYAFYLCDAVKGGHKHIADWIIEEHDVADSWVQYSGALTLTEKK